MTWVLGPILRVGDSAFAAISEVETAARAFGTAVSCHATKSPRLILRAERGRVSCAALTGAVPDAATIEARCPGALATMKDATSTDENQVRSGPGA